MQIFYVNVWPWHCLTFMDNLLFCKSERVWGSQSQLATGKTRHILRHRRVGVSWKSLEVGLPLKENRTYEFSIWGLLPFPCSLLLISDSKVSRKLRKSPSLSRSRGFRACLPLPLHPFHFFFAALTILLIAPLILQIPNCFFHPLALRRPAT